MTLEGPYGPGCDVVEEGDVVELVRMGGPRDGARIALAVLTITPEGVRFETEEGETILLDVVGEDPLPDTD